MSNVFVDTNLIVYSMDQSDPEKRDHCRQLLRSLVDHEAGVISTQILQEAYVVATRKLGMDPLEVKTALQNLAASFETLPITPSIIFQAIDCSVPNTLSFWDALLVAAASSARCDRLWTEALTPGQTLLGVRIENPLQDDAPPIRIDWQR